MKPDRQLAPEGTPAEFFANESGLVLVRKEFGTAREHIEPVLGLPKTLQVLSAKFTSGTPLPTDQQGILAALGPEGSPGYSTVPRGYAGLWTAADDSAAVVWTNLSEGYLYSYRPEHGSTPAHFTLVARPAEIGFLGIDAPIPPVRGYFLNESGKGMCTAKPRPVIPKFQLASAAERIARDCGLRHLPAGTPSEMKNSASPSLLHSMPHSFDRHGVELQGPRRYSWRLR